MKTFFIEIRETYIETKEVRANSLEEAKDIAFEEGLNLDRAEWLQDSTYVEEYTGDIYF